MNLKKNFLKHCEENKFEINQNQLEIINNLKKFIICKLIKENNIYKLGNNKKLSLFGLEI